MKGIFTVLLFGCLAFFSNLASAGDLRIVDAMGLTRFARQIRQPVVLDIKLKASPQVQGIVLSPVEGLATDQSGQPITEGLYRFGPVAEGNWRVVGKGGEVQVLEVSLVNHTNAQ